MPRFALPLLVLLLAASPLAAQDTPEAAALALNGAMRRADWPAAARLMHPLALRQMRGLFDFILDADGTDQLREQLFGFTSKAEASAAPDTVLFAGFLKAVMAQQGPEVQQAIKTATVTTAGHIAQGADTALVVTLTSMQVQGIAVSTYEVMPFLHDAQGWRALLKVDFTNMAAMLRRAAAVRRG